MVPAGCSPACASFAGLPACPPTFPSPCPPPPSALPALQDTRLKAKARLGGGASLTLKQVRAEAPLATQPFTP